MLTRFAAAIVLSTPLITLAAVDSPNGDELITLTPSNIAFTSSISWPDPDRQHHLPPAVLRQLQQQLGPNVQLPQADSGSTQPQSTTQLQITCNLPQQLPDGSTILEVINTTLNAAITDAGESLVPPANPNSQVVSSFRFGGMRHFLGEAVQTSLTLTVPQMEATRVASAEAALVVRTAGGAPSAVSIPIAGLAANHPVPVAGEMANALVISQVLPGQSVTIVSHQAIQERIAEVQFTDANGNEVRTNGWSSNGSGTSVTMSSNPFSGLAAQNHATTTTEYRCSLPADGVIVIHLHPPLQERRLTALLTDIPLPAMGPGRPAGAPGLDEQLSTPTP